VPSIVTPGATIVHRRARGHQNHKIPLFPPTTLPSPRPPPRPFVVQTNNRRGDARSCCARATPLLPRSCRFRTWRSFQRYTSWAVCESRLFGALEPHAHRADGDLPRSCRRALRLTMSSNYNSPAAFRRGDGRGKTAPSFVIGKASKPLASDRPFAVNLTFADQASGDTGGSRGSTDGHRLFHAVS